MKKKLPFLFFILIVFILHIPILFSQTPTTQGTEFYCSFMKNGYRGCNGSAYNDKLSVIASAPRATTVTVSNPNTGWSQNFSVPANGVNSILIPEAQCYSVNSEMIENKGLVITATDTISLFIGNEATYSFDASNVLPINALTDRYMIQTITPMTMNNTTLCHNINRGVFAIIATEDNTIIDITPKCRTEGGNNVNVTFDVTLNKGQTYHVRSQSGGSNGDFSGTRIQARDCKKIAVFNGIVSTGIPSTMENGLDHIFEQAVPTDYWGKRFAVTSSSDRDVDYVKITALQNETTIKKDGVSVSYIHSGQSYEFTLSDSPGVCYIETSKPCAVNLYQTTGGFDDSNGDPSMVWISPVEQQIKDITFSTFEAQEITDHYVNIVTKTDKVSSMRLNNNPITTPFRTFTADPSLSYAKVSIPAGAHHLSSEAGFTAHVYGFGYAQGYAYTVGSSTVALNRDIALDGIPSSQLPENHGICVNEEIRFSVIADFEYESLIWHLGDGTILNGDNVYHTYSEAGVYVVSACIKYSYANCLGSVYDTITLPVSVGAAYHIEDTLHLCESDFPYTHLGFQVDEPGHYFADELTVFGCDSIINLWVISHPEFEFYIEDMVCLEERYNRNGFSLQPHSNPGIYEYRKMYHTVFGCDSIAILTLRVSDISVWIPEGVPYFCEQNITNLNAYTANSTNVSTYLWSTGERTPDITVTYPGKYSVTVSDHQCTAQSDIIIEPCPLFIFIPNTITPYKPDGVNDYFSIVYTEEMKEIEIYIYNRSGSVIFHSTDPDFKWDGKVKGKIVHGIHSYILTVVDVYGKTHRFMGTLNVM